MYRLLKEPLLHFTLAGALLFVAYGVTRPAQPDDPQVVRLTAVEANWLRETWARQWQRSPTEDEFRGLLVDYLKEQLLAREAIALGFDQGDIIVQRRLAQKMEFFVKDTARLAEPTDVDLRQYYDARADRYAVPPRVTFTQHYFRAIEDAQHALVEVAEVDAVEADVGDSIMLDRDYVGADAQMVTALFGPVFSERVFALEPGSWEGPISSGYGFHLVLVSDRQAAQSKPFEDVRAQVLEEWYSEKQADAHEQYMAQLLNHYEVIIDDELRPFIGTLAEAAR